MNSRESCWIEADEVEDTWLIKTSSQSIKQGAQVTSKAAPGRRPMAAIGLKTRLGSSETRLKYRSTVNLSLKTQGK